MTLEKALDIIGEVLGNVDETLSAGLPGGSDEKWGYDETLVVEIGTACEKWQTRQSRKRSVEAANKRRTNPKGIQGSGGGSDADRNPYGDFEPAPGYDARKLIGGKKK